MTFSGRIRLYLVAVAILPLLAVMSVIYFHSVEQVESSDRQAAYQNMQKYRHVRKTLYDEISSDIDELLGSSVLARVSRALATGRASAVSLDPRLFNIDFIEILNSDSKVMFSFHRPGLLGDQVQPDSILVQMTDNVLVQTVEYDINGPHLAISFRQSIDQTSSVYGGRYLDDRYLKTVGDMLGAEVQLLLEIDTPTVFDRMTPLTLYEEKESYRAILETDSTRSFVMMAQFGRGATRPMFVSLLRLAGVVATLSALVAIGLGLLVTRGGQERDR